jgi:hypothetical protein
MIQAKGIIVGSNGIAKYTDPLINVDYASPDKFIGLIVTAEIGEVKEKTQNYSVFEEKEIVNPETEELETVKVEVPKTETINYWDKADTIASFTTKEEDPSFTTLQNQMLTKLKEAYPTVQFEIV